MGAPFPRLQLRREWERGGFPRISRALFCEGRSSGGSAALFVPCQAKPDSNMRDWRSETPTSKGQRRRRALGKQRRSRARMWCLESLCHVSFGNISQSLLLFDSNFYYSWWVSRKVFTGNVAWLRLCWGGGCGLEKHCWPSLRGPLINPGSHLGQTSAPEVALGVVKDPI